MVKLMNREKIVNELKQNPRQSRADLSKKTNLSKPAVSEIVKELIEDDLVFETGLGPSTGGKKPIYLEYNARSNYVLGTLIENETIFLALGDMNGEIINFHKEKFTPFSDGNVIVNIIAEGVRELLNREQIDDEKVLGMVIGVSGIKMNNEEVISSSPSINWDNVNLKQELSTRLNSQIIIENDVNLMTIGEFYKGEGIGINDFIYLFIGNGIGSGLFLDGKFYKGFHSAAGEIGYMVIGNQQPLSEDLGVFETNYGLFGVSKKLKQLNIDIQDEKSLLNFLQKNCDNKDIKTILEDTINQWAKAASNIISIIDPQAVILSGELTYLNNFYYNRFQRMIESYVPKIPQIKITELESKAGIYGALHLALQHFYEPNF
ncbi:ROK family transcriptional regulator [Salinibacillus aidingensis]